MAFGPQMSGIEFKVKGSVDPSFTSSMATAVQSTKLAESSGKSWKETLVGLAGGLKGTAAIVASFALEQKRHHDLAKAITGATVDQIKATNKLQTDAIAPLAAQLKELVEVQKQYQANIQQSAQNANGSASAFSGLSSQVATLGTATAGTADKMQGLRDAAQNVAYGDYTGAISGLITTLSGVAVPLAAITGAVALAEAGMDAYEEAQKKAGKEIETDSARLQKASVAWHELDKAIKEATNSRLNYPGAGSPSPDKDKTIGNTTAARTAVRGTTAADFTSAYNDATKPKSTDPTVQKAIDQKSAIDAEKAVVAQRIASLEGYKQAFRSESIAAANAREEVPTSIKIKDAGSAAALGRSGDFANSGGIIRAKYADAEKALAGLRKEFSKLSTESGAADEAIKKLNRFADATDAISKKKEALKDFASALAEVGGRANLVRSQEATDKAAGFAKNKYYGLTGSKATDTESLVGVITNDKASSKSKELAKELIEWNKKVAASAKAVSDFDAAAAKALVTESREKIAKLQEELDLRKALGKSSAEDQAQTLNKQIELLDPTDTTTRNKLLAKNQEEHGKFLEKDLKDQLGPLQDSYKELQADGNATATQLEAANKKVAKAAQEWRDRNAEILGQFPQIKSSLDQIQSGSRGESNRNKSKSQDEAFSNLKTIIGDQEAAALTTQARLQANKVAVEEVNEAYSKGQISQKQKIEEINVLTKARAGLERTVANEIEAQKKALTNLKATAAAERLARLQGKIERGEGGSDAPEKAQELEKRILRYKLDSIDQEYQAAVKAGKDQVMAAEEASLAKQRLYDAEADKFADAEKKKTDAAKSGDKNRVGGAASPLVGLGEGIKGAAIGTASLGRFGDSFGKYRGYGSSPEFDRYKESSVPEHLKGTFKQPASYEKPGAGAPAPGPVQNVYVSVAASDGMKAAAAALGKAVSDQVKQTKLTSGTGAPEMTKSDPYASIGAAIQGAA